MATRWYLNLVGEHAGTAISLIAQASPEVKFDSDPRVDWDWHCAEDEHDPYVEAPFLQQAQTGLTDGAFYNRLIVPIVGGRTYRTIAKHGDQELQTPEFQTWQKVWLTTHCMTPELAAVRQHFDLAALLEPAFIEVVLVDGTQCSMIEDVTLTSQMNLGLHHLYDEKEDPLNHRPTHVRMVLVQDLRDPQPFDVDWVMTKNIVMPVGAKVRVSCEPDNKVVYEHDLASIDPDQPFDELFVTPVIAVDVPASHVEYSEKFGLSIYSIEPSVYIEGRATDIDRAIDQLFMAINGGSALTIGGTVYGRACADGFKDNWVHEISGTLENRVWVPKEGSEHCQLTLNDDTLHFHNRRVLLAQKKAFKGIEIDDDELETYVEEKKTDDESKSDDESESDDDKVTFARIDEHDLVLTFKGEQVLSKLKGAEPVNIIMKYRGHEAESDEIQDEQIHMFRVAEITKDQSRTADGVEVNISTSGGSAHEISISGKTIAITKFNDLTLFRDADPIAVPKEAISVEETRVVIDLCHDALKPALEVFAAGGELKFRGKLRGGLPLGGYTRKSWPDFIAVSGKRKNGEDDEQLAHRLTRFVAHEIGHSLGLVQASVTNLRENTEVRNELQYDGAFGGQGSHCGYNTTLVPSGAHHGRPSTTSGQIRVPADEQSQVCIMFHRWDDRMDQYCPTCKTHLCRAAAVFQPQ